MSTPPLLAPAPALTPEGVDLRTADRVPITGRLRRLLGWYGVAFFGMWLTIGATHSIFIPLQVQALDPASKAANLAVVATLGALAGMVAQPIAGLLSDRTRNRRGRRAPWLLVGALVTAGGLVAQGGVGGMVGITGVYVLVNVSLNCYFGPLSAVMPDRVPRGVRGVFSAVSGLGVLFGVLGGQILGSVLADHLVAGYCVLAVVIVVAGVGFVARNPDHDSTHLPVEPMRWTALLRTFWVSPRRHPDFAWGFAGRLLTLLGFYLVSTFQLFLLQDYVGLGDDASHVLPLMSLTALVTTLLSTVAAGPLSDRIGRRKPIAVAAGLLIALSLIAPWVLPTTTGFVLYAAVAGLGFGAYLAVDQALLSEVLPGIEDNGRYLGVLNIAQALPSAMAAAIAGTIVATVGYAAIFPIGIVVAVLGSLAILPIRSVR